MQLDAMFLQLGIAGAMLLVAYRIAMKFMANQRETEKERTAVIQQAELDRTRAIQEGFRADNESHRAMTEALGKIASWVSRGQRVAPGDDRGAGQDRVMGLAYRRQTRHGSRSHASA